MLPPPSITPPPPPPPPSTPHGGGGGGPAFQALLATTEAAAADWGAGAAAAALPAAAAAALAEMESAASTSATTNSSPSETTATPATTTATTAKSPLRRLLEEAGWDGRSFSPTSFDAKALLSRLKTLHFDDLEEVGKGSYAVVYKVSFLIFFSKKKKKARSQDEKEKKTKLNLGRNCRRTFSLVSRARFPLLLATSSSQAFSRSNRINSTRKTTTESKTGEGQAHGRRHLAQAPPRRHRDPSSAFDLDDDDKFDLDLFFFRPWPPGLGHPGSLPPLAARPPQRRQAP